MKNNSYDPNFQDFYVVVFEEINCHLSLCLHVSVFRCGFVCGFYIFIGNMGKVIKLFNQEILNVKI